MRGEGNAESGADPAIAGSPQALKAVKKLVVEITAAEAGKAAL